VYTVEMWNLLIAAVLIAIGILVVLAVISTIAHFIEMLYEDYVEFYDRFRAWRERARCGK
jgi:hypothetical protein